MSAATTEYTPTELRMLDVLADGYPHTREALHACLYDDQSPLSAIQHHISRMRKKLRPYRQDIVCELAGGVICYRHVRLITSLA